MDSIENSETINAALDTARQHANSQFCGWGEDLDLYVKSENSLHYQQSSAQYSATIALTASGALLLGAWFWVRNEYNKVVDWMALNKATLDAVETEK